MLPTSLVFDRDHKLIQRFDGVWDKDGLRLSLFGAQGEEIEPAVESNICGDPQLP